MSELYYGFSQHMIELLARLDSIEKLLATILAEQRERVSGEGA